MAGTEGYSPAPPHAALDHDPEGACALVKKHANIDPLIESTLAGARRRKLLGPVSDTVAADSSGWESAHVSRYFGKRCGRSYRRFPKLSACIDTRSHLCLAAVVDRGPQPDDLEFKPLLRSARRRHRFRALLADGTPAINRRRPPATMPSIIIAF
jgi:hypothetical protein